MLGDIGRFAFDQKFGKFRVENKIMEYSVLFI